MRSRTRAGPSSQSTRRRRGRESPAPAAHRVGEVALDGVVGEQRRRDAALRVAGVALGELGLRDELDRVPGSVAFTASRARRCRRRRRARAPCQAPDGHGNGDRRGRLRREHPLERESRRVGDVVGHRDAVDDATRDELLEHPREVARVDAVHRRARAHDGVEAEDRVLRVLGGEALHHVDLGADREGRAGAVRGLDGLQDVVGRARVVGRVDDRHRAFGVHDHPHARVLGACLLDLVDREALVHRAEAVPQDDAGVFSSSAVLPPSGLARVPHRHLLERHAHLLRGVAAEVLVGEEQHALPALERPLEHGLAFDDVQTMPPCRPQKPLSAAEEFM